MEAIHEYKLPDGIADDAIAATKIYWQGAARLEMQDLPAGGAASGTLYVTESNVTLWNKDTGAGCCVKYTDLCIHAVSREPDRAPCIYCQLEDITGNGQLVEARLIPDDANALKDIFEALSDCQALHPSAQQDGEDFQDGGGGAGM
eukprot:UC1_evm1s364